MLDNSIYLENIVIIRVWSGAIWGGKDIGHVSLEIPKLEMYASFWPGTPKTPVPGRRDPKFNTLYEDNCSEKRAPELKYYLFSLDIQRMKKKFDQLKENMVGWFASGQTSSYEHVNNCASLVYEILRQGNIKNLASPKSFSGSSAVAFSWIPNILAKYVQSAVNNERKQFPITVKLEEEYSKGNIVIKAVSSARLGGYAGMFGRKHLSNINAEKRPVEKISEKTSSDVDGGKVEAAVIHPPNHDMLSMALKHKKALFICILFLLLYVMTYKSGYQMTLKK